MRHFADGHVEFAERDSCTRGGKAADPDDVPGFEQLLEGNVLQPMIQSRTLQMHPAVILLAITAGASVAGVLGMLLSVPMTAAVFGVVSELRARYEDTGAPLRHDT